MDYPNNNQQKGGVSKGEMFVATNLLSKIGALFVIASVIAFSAVSEGYLSASVRMLLVLGVGAVMLGVGAFFFKKGSVIFSNALIYGGVAELFICSLIGYHGFEVWGSAGSLVMGAVAAAIGVLMSLFTRSQVLLTVTIVFSVLPIFVDISPLTVGAVAVYLVVIHAVNAIISRKKYYAVSHTAGVITAIIETVFIAIMSYSEFYASSAVMIDGRWIEWGYIHAAIFTVVFVLSAAIVYSSAPLFNSLDSDGNLDGSDAAILCIIHSVLIFTVFLCLRLTVNSIFAAVGLGILAVIYAFAAAGFGLKFWSRCTVTTVFINLILASAVLGITFLIETSPARYITMHVLACALLILGVLRERALFKNWGYTLLGFSELLFFGMLMTTDNVPAIITNLALWFALLVFFIAIKKTGSALFSVYTCLALLNAGILGSYLISEHLSRALNSSGWWMNSAGRAAFSALLCATLWMLLGFIAGKLKYLKLWSSIASFTFYGIGLLCLAWGNFANTFSRWNEDYLGSVMIIVTVVVNVVSVLSVLDITLKIEEKAPKFAKAVGLVVSAYAIMSLTTILGTNGFVEFTSCIISIIYIVTAIIWIVIGFLKLNALLRRFGLALVLLASAKLFLFDFIGIDPMGRTLLFIGFGITLLVISFAYGIAEKRLKNRENKS